MGMNAFYNLWSVTQSEMLSVWGLIMEKNTLAEYQKEYQLLHGEKYLNSLITLIEVFPVLRIVIKVNTIVLAISLSLK